MSRGDTGECDTGPRIAVLTQQISNYHAARYHAARAVFADVQVVSVANRADFAEFLADGEIAHAVCSGDADYAAAIADGSLGRRVAQVLDDIVPDVVAVAGWSFPESLAAIAWARRSGRGVVMMSASQAHDGPRAAWREWIKARVVGACHAALVAGPGHADYIATLGMARDAIFMGYDAVDNAHFGKGAATARADALASRAAHGLPERYLLASGRFIAKKNYPALATAFAQALQREDTGHDLVILGDGPERAAIEDAIVRAEVQGRVHLPGFRPYDALPAFYGLADGFVHVSLAEQWGLVVNEAAAAGLPLVVSRPCGAAATLVQPGVNGWLVDPNDVSAIARALAGMMRLTPQQRAEMGEQSARIVADWGPDRFAAGLLNAARKAMEATSPAQPRPLPLMDRTLFDRLARLRIEKVS